MGFVIYQFLNSFVYLTYLNQMLHFPTDKLHSRALRNNLLDKREYIAADIYSLPRSIQGFTPPHLRRASVSKYKYKTWALEIWLTSVDYRIKIRKIARLLPYIRPQPFIDPQAILAFFYNLTTFPNISWNHSRC